MVGLERYIKVIKQWLIQDVPSHLYPCQGCNQTSCTQFDWEHCEYRLHSKDALKKPQKQANL